VRAPIVSVVVPACDAAADLDRLLACLEAQTLGPERFEVIVVDDASTDGTADAARGRSAPLRLETVSHAVRRGAWAARNTGWRLARGGYVAFLDADVIPAPCWLAVLTSEAARTGCDVVSGSRRTLRLECLGPLEARPTGGPDGPPIAVATAAWSARLVAAGEQGSRRVPRSGLLERELSDLCASDPRNPLCAWLLDASSVLVTRGLLERVHGFCPTGGRFADVDVGLAGWEGGASFRVAADAASSRVVIGLSPGPADVFGDVLSLFLRRPYADVLRVACWLYHSGPEAAPLARGAQHCDCAALAEDVARVFARQVPAHCAVTSDELLEHLSDVTNADAATRAQLRAWLDAATAAGVYREVGPDGVSRFDRHLLANWLESCTPFKELDLRQSYGFTHRTPRQRRPELAGAPGPGPMSLRVRGTYEVQVGAEALELLGDRAVISMAVPARGSHQPEVNVLEGWPASFAKHLDRDRAMVKSLPLRRVDGACAGFRFECLVREVVTGAGAPDEGEPDPAQHLRLTLPEAKIAPLAREILGAAASDEPFVRAEVIYRWLVESTGYRDSRLGPVAVLETGVGTCLARARLFVNLCRAAGIAARERRGALLGRSAGEGATETVTRGHGVFSHVWAEFLDPRRGWAPVEFLGAGWGNRMLTTRNVIDPVLREDVEASSEALEGYYFGSLDPFRVHVSDEAARFPTYPLAPVRLDAPALERVLWATRHRLRCQVERIE
jgi:hypothetical protein